MRSYVFRPRRRIFDFSLTVWIIILNFLVFVILSAIFGRSLFSGGGFVLKNIALSFNNILHFRVWTLLTSMFMHGSWTHLIFNMVSLFFIGSFVEKIIGRRRYFWLYILGGIFAGLFFVTLAGLFGDFSWGAKLFGTKFVFAVGASGAIFALGGLLSVLTPKMRVWVMFVIPLPMWVAMVGLLGFFWLMSLSLPIGIGNTAHLGGLLAGVFYGFYLKKKFPRKIKYLQSRFR
ncbi:hypothetical protein B6U91_00100 [Candidatus Pacearchaeota archaeon ex4484_71]|nr:MAG: hypothetical protein B6U91_00100 [Candidatus Pacearchaeota archaeon ex4484_71]